MSSRFLDQKASEIAAERIRELLRRNNHNPIDVVRQLKGSYKVSHHTIRRVANGTTKVRKYLVEALAAKYDYLTSDLVSDRPLPELPSDSELEPGFKIERRAPFAECFLRSVKEADISGTFFLWRRRVPRQSIEDCANYIRGRLRLGAAPAPSMLVVLSMAGILALQNDFARASSLACAGFREGRPFVMVPTAICDSTSTPEIRVQLAEKLGMIAMYSRARGGFPTATVAHEFARKFLLPEGTRTFFDFRKITDQRGFRALANFYSVPLSLLAERFADWRATVPESAAEGVGWDSWQGCWGAARLVRAKAK